jgi:Holliday junction DNA helicase RuvA
MIDREDVKSLSKLPKIGKKTAEQMILTLKGKLVLDERVEQAPRGRKRELVTALLNLGFRSSDIDKVMSGLSEDIELEEGLRQALASLTTL